MKPASSSRRASAWKAPAVALFLTVALGGSSAPLTLHVAPNGNDQWSGRLASPAPGGKDGPLATLPAALQAARAARQAGRGGDGVTILLRGGTYELSEPLALTPEDSGSSAQAPLVIAAYANEKPVLSGGRRLTGWKPVAGKPGHWQVTVPEARAGQWYFRSLFVNGERKQRARTPNEGFFRIQGDSPQDKPVKLRYAEGDIKPQWAGSEAEVIALLAWADFRYYIRSVDAANRVATLSGDPRPSNKEKNARYFIENAPDGCDAPGEWYLDRQTGVVTYLAAPGEADLNKAEVIAPRLTELLLFRGDLTARRPVRHVVLRGLTFSHTDWTMGTNGYADTQAAVATRGELFAEGATDCVVEDCVFTHLGGYAVDLGRGCQRWRIVGNELSDLGGGGVRLGEPGKRAEPFEANHSHVVTDNHLHHLGVVYSPAVAVFILQSGTNRIAHNHIHHLYYTAVSVGWNWGYQETPCRENIVEFNHMHDIGQNMLSDMGAVYTLGIQKGTVIRNNLIHDVVAFTYGGWGLYPDEGSSDIVWENNVVYRCKSAGFHQHYGRENLVRNNIFAFHRENQLMRSREEQHTSFIFTNNIVYFDSGNLLGSSWKNDRFVLDRNLYFDTRVGAKPEDMKFAGATLEQWRARGHDVNSIIADPLFVAPDKHDFRLRPDSPARKLGFRPIDLSAVGVRPKAARRAAETAAR